jgi:hypothetical protein
MCTGSDVPSFTVMEGFVAVCPRVNCVACREDELPKTQENGKLTCTERDDEKEGFCRETTVTVEEVIAEHMRCCF